MAVGRDVREKFLNHLEAKLRMLHFPAAEFQRDLDLHVVAKEIDRVMDLHAEVVGIDARAELDFLDRAGVLMLLGFLVLLRLFVTELAVIDEPADGRRGGGGDLDEIHAVGAGEVQRFAEREDADLFVVDPDDPHFAGTDFPIDPDERSGGGGMTWRVRSAQATLVG